ncbi:hypothetical protein [Curtobacterium sp. B18]|uniref:hypothetical protein n=1 Tax=Curtobacterium sp. B18 TaxID=95614 RepID=UPI0011D2453F|nr:hypothetical protein [Curtobacterium sp. B18]
MDDEEDLVGGPVVERRPKAAKVRVPREESAPDDSSELDRIVGDPDRRDPAVPHGEADRRPHHDRVERTVERQADRGAPASREEHDDAADQCTERCRPQTAEDDPPLGELHRTELQDLRWGVVHSTKDSDPPR